MKKSFFFAIVALGMIVACRKEVQVQGPEIDDNAPVAVQFNVNAPTITVTKTKAAVDQWANTQIYIYSGVQTESTSTGTDGTTKTKYISFANPLIDNVTATVAADGKVTFDSNKSYYYDVDSVYDFYAYYIGDATIDPSEPASGTDNSFSATVTIDGSQDIMVATTDHDKDMANATEPVNSNYIYSAYAARRGVHPTLNFEHMLSRFEFRVKQGNNPNSSTSKGVVVTGISIESYTQGTLTIAPTPSFVPKTSTTDTGADDDDNPSTVADDDNTTSTDTRVAISNDVKTGNAVDPSKTDDSQPDYVSGGSDLMVFPGDETLKLNVTLAPKDSELGVSVDPMTVTLNAAEITKKNGATFEAGKKYIVTITVYNLEQISVTADLAQWEDGGETTYDPDDKYDEEITPYSTLLENGTYLYHFAENLVVGASVYTDEEFETPAADGDYDTGNKIYTVANGKVTAVYEYYVTKTKTLPLYHAEETLVVGTFVYGDKKLTSKAAYNKYDAENGGHYINVQGGEVIEIVNYFTTTLKNSNEQAVTFYHAVETIAVNTAVYDDFKLETSIADGTYTFDDQTEQKRATYTVKDGVVTEISEE